MINFNEVINILKNKDPLLRNLIDVHFHKLGKLAYGKINLLGIYPIINKIIQHNNYNLILVLPAKKEIAYLSSLFAALSFYKKDFQKRLEDFENWLKPDINVMLCSSGKETGKIYRYLGKKNDNLISLGSLIDKSIKIDHKIETLLQLSPISDNNLNKQKIGTKGFIPHPIKSRIDEILNIKSYDNPMLYKNKIIVLTNFFSSFDKFLNTEILLSNINQTNNDNTLAEIIKSGQIDEDGNIKDHSVEPLMVYTRDLGSIYEFSKKTDDEKLIICDDIKKLCENFPIIEQIKNNNKNFKFLVFAEEHEYDYVKSFKENNNSEVWKFSNKEIETFISQIKHDDFDLNKSFPGRAYLKSRNHISKRDIYLDTDDTVFNLIDNKIKKIVDRIRYYDDTKKDNIRDLISGIRKKMYELRDHIFGFPDKLKEETKFVIDLYFTKLNSMESFLDNELFDELIELGKIFKNIKMSNTNIFDKRLDELHENLKLRENEGKNDYAILAYNPDRKIYYKKNIKEKWGIDANVINSIDNIRSFKSLIIPSELVQSKIIKLLLSDNFENVYFIGSKSLKEEINSVKDHLFNRWINLNMSNDRKCEILDIDKKFINSFFQPDQPKPKELKDYEDFFRIKDLSNYTNDITSGQSDEEAIKLPAFLTIFNGDCFTLATEDFSFKILNSVFDPSAFEKRGKIVKKNYQQIKIGDIVLMRHESDSEALDHEAILRLNNDKEKYFNIKEKTKKIPNIINKCLESTHDRLNSENIIMPSARFPRNKKSLLNYVLKKVNYTKGINNVLSLSDINGGTICPKNPEDLKKIFKACALICSEFKTDAYRYDEKEVLEMFKDAQEYKSIRQSAGFSLSKKLDQALIREAHNIEFDGDPLRVDYIDGNIIFGSETAGKPEGYIVQVNNFEEPKTLKEVKASITNRLLFL